jgi:hypothetical protein
MATDNKIPDDLEPVQTPEDLQPVQEPSTFQKLLATTAGPAKTYSDYMKNLVNTGTLGLEPKAEAGLKALLARIKGEPEAAPELQTIDDKTFGKVDVTPNAQPASLPDLYAKYKALGQQDLAKTQQSSPIASNAGQIVGIVPAALGVEATGIPGAVTEGLGLGEAGIAAGEAAPGVLDTILGKTATGAVQGGVTGGGIAAVQGDDIGQGIKTGMLVGGGLSALGAGGAALVQKTADIAEPYVQQIPYLRQLKSAFQGGDSAIGDQARTALKQQESNMADELSQNMINGRNILGDNIDKTIQQAADRGITIELDANSAGSLKRFLMDNRTRLSPGDFKSLFNKVASFEAEGEINPVELNSFRKELQQATSHLTNPDSIDTRNAVVKGVNSTLDMIPGYKQANEVFHDYNQALPEELLNSGSKAPKYLSEFSDPQAAFKEKLQDLFQKIGFRTEPGTDALESLENVKSNLNDFNIKHPGKLDQLGLDPEKYVKLIKDQGDVSALRIRQTGEGVSGLGALPSMVKNAPMTAAPILGKAVKAGGAALSRLKYASPEELTGAAAKLQADPELKDLGDQLAKSVSTNNDFLKNAAIFKLLQIPKAKEVLGSDTEP